MLARVSMAAPKRKVSPSRIGMRHLHKKMHPNNAECSNCKGYYIPHRVCSCGYYRGKKVLNG